jgi:hypothetical protein
MKAKILIAALALSSLSACGASEKKGDPAGGANPKEGIKSVITSRSGDIQKCYATELKNSPNLEGKVVAGWLIGNGGKVSKSWVQSSTVNSKPLESCMLNQINTWEFQSPQGDQVIDVSYPFVFKIQKD